MAALEGERSPELEREEGIPPSRVVHLREQRAREAQAESRPQQLVDRPEAERSECQLPAPFRRDTAVDLER